MAKKKHTKLTPQDREARDLGFNPFGTLDDHGQNVATDVEQEATMLDGAKAFLLRFGYLSKKQYDQATSWKDIALASAIAQYQRMDANVEMLRSLQGEDLLPDGIMGPATFAAMSLPRCAHPDCVDGEEVAAAFGTGGWKGCHEFDDIHNLVVEVNYNGFPSYIEQGTWKRILKSVQDGYLEIGLYVRFVDKDTHTDQLTGEVLKDKIGPINTKMIFTNEGRSGGWIGLAIVGPSSCSQPIWQKYQYTYGRGQSQEWLFNQWSTLIAHELGHNVGLRHLRGGIMNPGLINGLPTGKQMWINDGHRPQLTRMYGGPIVKPGGPAPPPPGGPGDGEVPVGAPLSDVFEVYGTGMNGQIFRSMSS